MCHQDDAGYCGYHDANEIMGYIKIILMSKGGDRPMLCSAGQNNPGKLSSFKKKSSLVVQMINPKTSEEFFHPFSKHLLKEMCQY